MRTSHLVGKNSLSILVKEGLLWVINAKEMDQVFIVDAGSRGKTIICPVSQVR